MIGDGVCIDTIFSIREAECRRGVDRRNCRRKTEMKTNVPDENKQYH